MRLPYVHEDTDRHGNVRVYFWRGKGHRKVRLRQEPGSEAFLTEYNTALAENTSKPAEKGRGIKPGTLRWLLVRYLESPEYRSLAASTRSARRHVLERCLEEKIAPDRTETFADFPLKLLSSKAIRVLRDRKGAELPEAANQRVKALRQLFAWAVEAELLTQGNPATDVRYVRNRSTGHHSWTPQEVDAYLAKHEIGTKARLAIDLLLYTGFRRDDVIVVGRQHARSEWLRLATGKNGTLVEIPILPILQKTIDASPTGDLTFIVSEYGQPYSNGGFGNRFKKWCREAGLPEHCTAHGLRKAGATRASENGATTHQLMAIYGWVTTRQAETYTREANRRRMAGDGMHTLERREQK